MNLVKTRKTVISTGAAQSHRAAKRRNPRISHFVFVLCAWLVFLSARANPQATPTAPPASAHSTLPAAEPTAQPATPAPAATPRQEPKRARIAYTQGLLFVSADNSSLNQILRQISRETGIKITGGVADERVFGQYGPSAPSQILAALLDGTGSNMLLLHRDGSTPAELVLTPRLGGPTPPNPSAAVFNEQNESVNESENSHDNEQNHSPAPILPPDQNGPPVSPSSNSAGPNGATEPQSPNGVKTPQQIYDQLQRLRTQQQPPPQ